MSELHPPPEHAERPEFRRHGAWGGHAAEDIRTLHRWASVLPATAMGLLGSITVAFLLTQNPSTSTIRVVLAVAVGLAVLVVFGSVRAAGSATRRVHQRLDSLRALNTRGLGDLRSLVDRVQRGERPAPRGTEPPAANDSDSFTSLGRDLQQGHNAAHNAVLQVMNLTPSGEPDLRVEVFVNLARRMQSLVHREIGLLDDLEAQVEDPDLLKGLFTVDHLATRMRRQSESLAVLGGAVSRRQWARSVGMQEVLRAAIAEVEHYSRVKVAPPIEGTLQGNAVADVIHLIAELVENATKFSAPHTQVVLRAEHVTAGLAIEVDDRGLGMPLADQHRINGLLADPGRINISELLYDGRIGLFVVSALARRHRIRVQLQTNIYGGIQAVVVLPAGLIDAISPKASTQPHTPEPAETRPDPVTPTRIASTPPAAPAVPTPSPRPVPAPGTPPATPAAEAPVPHARRGEAPGPGPEAGHPYPASGAPAGPVGSWLPDLPRRPSPRPIRPNTNHAPAPPAAPTPVANRPDQDADQPAEPGRPVLPQRRAQTHVAPQLRDAPAGRRDTPGHTPGLMAAFQGGVSRADEEDDSVANADGMP